MASGLVNDLLQSNIQKLDVLSNQILDQLAELQANQLNLANGISDDESDDEAQEVSSFMLNIQDNYAKINQLVDQIKNPTTKKSTNEKKLSISQLSGILKSYKDGSIMDKITSTSSSIDTSVRSPYQTKQLELVSNLETLTILYSFIALYQITLSEVLTSTLPLVDDLFYWEIISSSNLRSIIYALQTLPIRTTGLAAKIVKELTNAARPNVEGLDVQIPSYILTNHPEYSDTYKRFIYYKDLLIKSIYHNVFTNNLKGFYKTLNGKNAIGLRSHSKPFFKNYLSIIIGAPFKSIQEELRERTDYIQTKQNTNAKILGSLISNIPDVDKLFNNPNLIKEALTTFNLNIGVGNQSQIDNDVYKSIYLISATSVPHLQDYLRLSKLKTSKPNFLTRYWPTILLFGLYGPNAIISVISNKDEIIKFVKVNLVDTIKGFFKNWIFKPVNNILSTIRHDDNSEISIMSKHALDSDLESLKRMVIDYTLENDPTYKNLSGDQLTSLKLDLERLTATGDLTPLMKEYESEIKRPLKSLISGKLTRSLLIQLQKTKVDGAVAINGIDKLLKSQELVFGIVAASPSLIILVYLLKGFQSYLNKGYITRSASEKKLIASKNLNNIERLLNITQETIDNDDELNHIYGLLLLEIFSLRKSGLYLIPKNRKVEWIRDMNDLSDGTLSISVKLNTINRIYHVYGTYFQ